MNRIGGTLLFLLGAYLTVNTRLDHPELTETQLFLDYWHVWIVAFAALLWGMVLWSKE